MKSNKQYFDDLFKEIYAHILSHKSFHGIYMEKSPIALTVIVECHCCKKWEIPYGMFRDAQVDYSDLLVDSINYMNSPDFFVELKKVKSEERKATAMKEYVSSVIQDPMISSLDF